MSDSDRRNFFEAQVYRLLDRLYGRALRLTRDRGAAEELVAETLLRAWAKLDELRDREKFDGWVFTILTNIFISDRRRRAPEPPLEADDVAIDPANEFSLFRRLHQPFLLWWGTPEQAFLDKLLREDIDRALDRLPETYRTAVVLVDVQGCSYAEVSRLLEVPVGTVRSRLSRGRSLLQRALWQHAVESGIAGGARSERKKA